MSLIQLLVQKGMLEKEKAVSLDFEIKQSGRREEEVILEKGVIPEEILYRFKSEDLKIPLKDITIEEVLLKTLELIPEETSKYYKMIPLAKTDKFLEIGMVYPEDFKAQEALQFLARQGKFNYKVFLITPTNFDNILKQYHTLKKEVGMALEELETELKEENLEMEEKMSTEFERMAEEAPVTKIVAVILRHAVEGNASDIHIEPTPDKLRVRFRQLGVLHVSIILPLRIHPAVIARIKILSNLKIDETRMPQDGRFSTKLNGKTIDFRVSTFPTTLGEKVVLRVLDPKIGLKTFEDLGLGQRNLELIKKGISRPFGLILITGPTGSGKSTTLYAILHSLNKEGINIITLEDPAEYFIEGVNQSQIKPEIGYDFPTGLRHILRQDPNVIMVGEIRDQETANLVIHSALTGHIVLSTLHTTNTAGVIPRLIDLGVQPFLIPSTLHLAIAQRLVKRLCDKCKKKIKAGAEVRDLILKVVEELPDSTKKELNIATPLTIWQAVGCAECGNSGFSGRVAVYEILSMTPALAEITLESPSESKIAKEAKRQGMITMMEDGIIKVINGITTIEEVLRATEEKE